VSKATITALLENTLQDSWSATPIAWQNVEARDHAIAGAPLLSAGSKNYINFSVDITKTEAMEIPLGFIRYSGFIGVDVNTMEGAGTRAADTLIDSLNELFQYQVISDGSTCIRTHEYLDSGTFIILEGWATHACQWPFSVEFRRAV
jgi:hypothetical protein